jgi:uncharacterized protein (TIGR02452 family)
MSFQRSHAAALGREAAQILQAGQYTTADSRVVPLGDLLRRAADGTRTYPPDLRPRWAGSGDAEMSVEVENESTLAAAWRLVREGHRPAALNFASARNPGGGWLSGARAQEESLARASGLTACLVGNPMYDFHRASPDALYTDYAIYSPDVPVFRDDDGALLPEPYLCTFITSPAPNAKVVLERDRSRRGEVREAMRRRIDKVLAVAAAHGHDAAVLGAWGCGVFGNDTVEVAGLFRAALETRFRGAFQRIVFAVLDWSDERRFIGPFYRAFGLPVR